MQVTVRVSANVARALRRRGAPDTESQCLARTIESLGLKLEPLHTDANDPVLQTYFTVSVPDQAAAQRLIERLNQSAGVDAVYLKPADELP